MPNYINPQGKLLRHPDRLAAWRAGTPFMPIGVEIDLTNRCNLGCAFCHFGYTHSRGPLAKSVKPEWVEQLGDEFEWQLLGSVLNQLGAAGVKSVTFSGGGEPTLYPSFRKAAIVARQSMGLKLGLYTNGTRIDAELGRFIKRYFEWAVVSLDTDNAEDYARLKKVNAFDKACEGIVNLFHAVGDCKVGVSFLLDEGNWNRVWQMYELHKELGSDYAEFRPIVHFDLNTPNQPSADTKWIAQAMPPLTALAAKDDVHVSMDKFARLRRWQGHGYATCHATQFTSVITPNGKVWVCVNRRGFPDSCIGDLNQESFTTIMARHKPFAVNAQCRVLCRADSLNLALDQLATPLPHEEFL